MDVLKFKAQKCAPFLEGLGKDAPPAAVTQPSWAVSAAKIKTGCNCEALRDIESKEIYEDAVLV